MNTLWLHLSVSQSQWALGNNEKKNALKNKLNKKYLSATFKKWT